jgi:hypothetical protein
MIISGSIHVRMRYVSDKSCTVSENTHVMFKTFFLKNCAVYEIKCKNTGEPD